MKRIILTAILVAALAAMGYAQTITAYVIESAPMGMNDGGRATGEHVEYLRLLAERVGVDLELEVVPKSRLIGALREGTIDMAITFRSPKWDEFVEWSGLVREIRIVGVNRTGKALSDYNGLYASSRVGVLNNSFVSPQFDNDSRIAKYQVPTYDTMVQLLAARRIDTAVGNAISISYVIDREGVSAAVQSSGITLGTQEQWLAFCKNSPNRHLAPVFGQALQELQAEGVLDEILTSYAGTTWRSLNRLD